MRHLRLMNIMRHMRLMRPMTGCARCGARRDAARSDMMRGRNAGRRGFAQWPMSRVNRSGPFRRPLDRLRARGEAARAVLVAVARKLLVIANAMPRRGTARDPKLAQTA
jgi:hypothetical protein